jgi:hypothetical protein
MIFEEFQHLARLSVVGALDPDEAERFQAGRHEFGEEAERFLRECRKLNAVFALSLRPCEPDPRTKVRLLARIRELSQQKEEKQPKETLLLRPLAARR